MGEKRNLLRALDRRKQKTIREGSKDPGEQVCLAAGKGR